MFDIEKLYIDNNLHTKFSKKEVKFIKDAIFDRFEVITSSNIKNGKIYMANDNVYKFDDNFYDRLQGIGFTGKIYKHVPSVIELPKITMTDDILLICGYFSTQKNFQGTFSKNLEGFDEFYSVFIKLLEKKNITMEPKKLYKIGKTADYLVCDFVKIACFNAIISKPIPTAYYYALKLLKFINTEQRTKFAKQINFIYDHYEKNYTEDSVHVKRNTRKIRKIIKYLSGLQIKYGNGHLQYANYIYHCNTSMLNFIDSSYSNTDNSSMLNYINRGSYSYYDGINKPLNSIPYKLPDIPLEYLLKYFNLDTNEKKLPTISLLPFTQCKFDINILQKIFYNDLDISETQCIETFNYAYKHNSEYIKIYIYNYAKNKFPDSSKVLAYFRLLIN